MKRILLLALLVANSAFAAIVGPLPFTIATGQPIQANPLQQNFSWLLNQVNANAAPLASPAFTGSPTLNGSTIFSSGSFTGTLTGCTTAPTVTISWYRVGKLVTLSIPSIFATSNSVSMSITGGPASIGNTTSWVNGTGQAQTPMPLENNGTIPGFGYTGLWVNPDGTIKFLLIGSDAGFANSGSKGLTFASGWTVSYFIQ